MVLHTLLMVVFVLVAIAMIVLILLQRGAGAQAGSGFGAGASGTVFGARGSANFLSSSTKWLAAVFFSLSLFMAWQSAHQAKAPKADAVEDATKKQDLGLMNEVPADAGKTAPAAPAGLPAAPAQALPAAPAPAAPATPQPATSEPVIAPAQSAPPPAAPAGKGG
jgi:preprotein translocase subunit SecG